MSRAAVRHFKTHVGAVDQWEMRIRNNVRPSVMWGLICSAIHAPFARKVVKSAAGCLIPVSMLNPFWL
jgi:hypothetical protein